MHFDFAARELTLKVVYYGPALSGKTTNLQILHDRVASGAGGRLMTLETKDDRTLFFDLLPLSFKARGVAVRLKVFTVPGQVIHAATRRLVVQGADGVVFVADSQEGQTEQNGVSFIDLKTNLDAQGMRLEEMPVVIQFNKRDLPEVRPLEDLHALAKRGREPVYLATATRGDGIVETFLGALHLTWRRLDARHGLAAKFDLRAEKLLSEVGAKFEVSDVQGAISSCLGGAEHFERCEAS